MFRMLPTGKVSYTYSINGKTILAEFRDTDGDGSTLITGTFHNGKSVFLNKDKQPGWHWLAKTHLNFPDITNFISEKYPNIYFLRISPACFLIQVRNKTSIQYVLVPREEEPTEVDARFLMPLYRSGYCRKDIGQMLSKIYASFSKEKMEILAKEYWTKSCYPSFKLDQRYKVRLVTLLKDKELRNSLVKKIIGGVD